MAKIYRCDMCKKDIIAPSMDEMLKKIQVHDKQKHNITQYSSEKLREVRRRIESYN